MFGLTFAPRRRSHPIKFVQVHVPPVFLTYGDAKILTPHCQQKEAPGSGRSHLFDPGTGPDWVRFLFFAVRRSSTAIAAKPHLPCPEASQQSREQGRLCIAFIVLFAWLVSSFSRSFSFLLHYNCTTSNFHAYCPREYVTRPRQPLKPRYGLGFQTIPEGDIDVRKISG